MENEHTNGFYILEYARLQNETARAINQRTEIYDFARSGCNLMPKPHYFYNLDMIATVYDMQTRTQAITDAHKLHSEILALESDCADAQMHISMSRNGRTIQSAMDIAYQKHCNKIGNKLINLFKRTR